MPRCTTIRSALLICVAVLIGYGSTAGYFRHERQAGFDLIAIGDSLASVKATLGAPSVVERGGSFTRYVIDKYH